MNKYRFTKDFPPTSLKAGTVIDSEDEGFSYFELALMLATGIIESIEEDVDWNFFQRQLDRKYKEEEWHKKVNQTIESVRSAVIRLETILNLPPQDKEL